MKNKNIALEILEQNYTIDTLVTFLSENNYYSENITKKQRNKILDQSIQLTENVRTFKNKFPEELKDKRASQLNEGPIWDAIKYIFTGRKAAEATKAGKEAGEVAKTAKPAKPPVKSADTAWDVEKEKGVRPEVTPGPAGGNLVKDTNKGDEIGLAPETDITTPQGAIDALRSGMRSAEEAQPALKADEWEKVREKQLEELSKRIYRDYMDAARETFTEKGASPAFIMNPTKSGEQTLGPLGAPRIGEGTSIDEFDQMVLEKLRNKNNNFFNLPKEKQDLILNQKAREYILRSSLEGKEPIIIGRPTEVEVEKQPVWVSQTKAEEPRRLQRELEAEGVPVGKSTDIRGSSKGEVTGVESPDVAQMFSGKRAELDMVLQQIESLKPIIDSAKRRGLSAQLEEAEKTLKKLTERKEKLQDEVGTLGAETYYQGLRNKPETLKRTGPTPDAPEVHDIVRKLSESRFFSNKKKFKIDLNEQIGGIVDLIKAGTKAAEEARGVGQAVRRASEEGRVLRPGEVRIPQTVVDNTIILKVGQRDALASQVTELEKLLKEARKRNYPESELKSIEDALNNFKKDLATLQKEIEVGMTSTVAEKGTEATQDSPLVAAAKKAGKPLPSDISKLSPEQIAAITQLSKTQEVQPTGGLNTPASVEEPVPTPVSAIDLSKVQGAVEAERQRRSRQEVPFTPSPQVDIPFITPAWERLAVEQPKPIIDPTKLVDDLRNMQDAIDRARSTGGLNTPASVEDEPSYPTGGLNTPASVEDEPSYPTGGLNTPASAEESPAETPAEALSRVIQSIMDPAGLNRFKKTYSTFDEIPQPATAPSSPVVPVPEPRPVPYPVPNPILPPGTVPSPRPRPTTVPSPVPTPGPGPRPSPRPSPSPQPSPTPEPEIPAQPEPRPETLPPGTVPQPRPRPDTIPSPVPQPGPAPRPYPRPKPSPQPFPTPLPTPKPGPSTPPAPGPTPVPIPKPVQPKPIPAPIPTPIPTPVPVPFPPRPTPQPPTPTPTPRPVPPVVPPTIPPIAPPINPPKKSDEKDERKKVKLPGLPIPSSEEPGSTENIDVHFTRGKIGSLGQGIAGTYRIV